MSIPLDKLFLISYIVCMFARKLLELMEKRKLTARELHANLNLRSVRVSLWTVRAWMQGTRKPKPYVQEAILNLLQITS